ncbi:unnamed protein product [Caenorhabditis sp. 36 PRJEB53466]|nr:unnamed protein product [Caenorhabditis sp. 36 PRJEB53466]
MFFWFSFLLANVCYKSSVSFNKNDHLRWVPPRAHDWKNSEIAQNVKVYWENKWAKASYLKGCSEENSLKIVPVYFWPGERVDLPCRMCQMAYITNGRIKRWGYSEDVDEFLLNPKQFVRVNELWEEVQNTEQFERDENELIDEENVIWYPHSRDLNDTDSFTSRVKTPPRYWQNEGKLTIFGADVRSQGVYFCYDEFSRKQTVLFFVLMAMLPPVRITSKEPTTFTDHCGHEQGEDSSKIFPSHNWRYHFLPMGDLNPPATCQLDDSDPEGCERKFPYLKKMSWPTNFGEECSVDRCRARLVSPDNSIDLYIELRWDAWTSCEGDQPTKRREGHCYLVRGTGSINIESMDMGKRALYSWIRNLETVFDRKPFDTDGIRLHSSILTSAIFDKPKITACYSKKDEENGMYEKFDKVWRHVFLPTLGVPDKGEVIQLENPFEACIRYIRMHVEDDLSGEEDFEHLVGTHSTQVDYC